MRARPAALDGTPSATAPLLILPPRGQYPSLHTLVRPQPAEAEQLNRLSRVAVRVFAAVLAPEAAPGLPPGPASVADLALAAELPTGATLMAVRELLDAGLARVPRVGEAPSTRVAVVGSGARALAARLAPVRELRDEMPTGPRSRWWGRLPADGHTFCLLAADVAPDGIDWAETVRGALGVIIAVDAEDTAQADTRRAEEADAALGACRAAGLPCVLAVADPHPEAPARLHALLRPAAPPRAIAAHDPRTARAALLALGAEALRTAQAKTAPDRLTACAALLAFGAEALRTTQTEAS
jgi:hypothetical protein